MDSTLTSSRSKQAELRPLVDKLRTAHKGLGKPAATRLGSLDENELAANVENRPELAVKTEEIPFEVIQEKTIKISQLDKRKSCQSWGSQMNVLLTSLFLHENGNQQKPFLIIQVTKGSL